MRKGRTFHSPLTVYQHVVDAHGVLAQSSVKPGQQIAGLGMRGDQPAAMRCVHIDEVQIISRLMEIKYGCPNWTNQAAQYQPRPCSAYQLDRGLAAGVPPSSLDACDIRLANFGMWLMGQEGQSLSSALPAVHRSESVLLIMPDRYQEWTTGISSSSTNILRLTG